MGSVVVASVTTVSVAVDPLAMVPTFQMPVRRVYVPCEGVAETNVRPAGRLSVTPRRWRLPGPALCAVTVKVTF